MNPQAWSKIVNSLPDEFTVEYSALSSGDPWELRKLEAITGLSNVLSEPFEHRYAGPYDWCRS